MEQYLCWNCKEKINGLNKSKEHIIPDSLGGTKGFHSYNLLCKICNSTYGETIDLELFNQLSPIAIMIDAPRDRPKIRHLTGVTKQGEAMTVHNGLKGNWTIEVKVGSIDFKIVETSQEKAVARLKKWVQQYNKKASKKIALEKENLTFEDRPIKDEVYFSNNKEDEYQSNFGSMQLHLAIIKIAVNFARLHNIDIKHLHYPIEILKSKNPEKFTLISNFIYKEEKIISGHNNEVSHTLFLVGDSDSEVLYCYIQLFSFIKFIVLLDQDYDGKNLTKSYSYELIKHKRISRKEIFLVESKLFFLDLKNTVFKPEIFNKEVERVYKIIEQNQ